MLVKAVSLKEQFAQDFEHSKKYIELMKQKCEVKEWSTSGYETFESADLREWAIMWADELCPGLMLKENYYMYWNSTVSISS